MSWESLLRGVARIFGGFAPRRSARQKILDKAGIQDPDEAAWDALQGDWDAISRDGQQVQRDFGRS